MNHREKMVENCVHLAQLQCIKTTFNEIEAKL